MAKARVENYNGSPAIMIDGVPYPPMMATIRTNNIKEAELDTEYYRELGKSGIKIFFLICDTEWGRPGEMESLTKEAQMLFSAIPDAYVILRVGMHPPLSWCKENPDELMQYSDGKTKKAHVANESFEEMYDSMYSLCSSKWREDAGKALIDTYNKINELPFADRIIGYFFAAGGTSEWYYLTPTEYTDKSVYCDTGGFDKVLD